MQVVSNGDNSQEMSDPFFLGGGGGEINITILSSVELAKTVVKVKLVWWIQARFCNSGNVWKKLNQK